MHLKCRLRNGGHFVQEKMSSAPGDPEPRYHYIDVAILSNNGSALAKSLVGERDGDPFGCWVRLLNSLQRALDTYDELEIFQEVFWKKFINRILIQV